MPNTNTSTTGSTTPANAGGGSSRLQRHIPSLSLKTGSGRPASKYIKPGSGSNPSCHFILPGNEEILDDIERCYGLVEVFLEAACGDQDMRAQLWFEITQQMSGSPEDYAAFTKMVTTGQNAQRMRLTGLALDAVESCLATDKPPVQVLTHFLKGTTAGAPGKPARNPYDGYLTQLGDD